MTEVFFNYSDADNELIDRRGVTVTDYSEVFSRAETLVRSMLMKPNSEDWRGWELQVTDSLGCEIFTLQFASVLGKPH
jgi:hypothetical protein